MDVEVGIDRPDVPMQLDQRVEVGEAGQLGAVRIERRRFLAGGRVSIERRVLKEVRIASSRSCGGGVGVAV
ncbi:hypothetical protein ACQP2E_10430 [Actinoplanes sp. CA-015351]|uniref:hypothetical protein n=1 Tax=Actinoplanes sp. CA-015351 TaxID=3239897 RepID=UPI003D960707